METGSRAACVGKGVIVGVGVRVGNGVGVDVSVVVAVHVAVGAAANIFVFSNTTMSTIVIGISAKKIPPAAKNQIVFVERLTGLGYPAGAIDTFTMLVEIGSF
jgi:hypothetical protein